MQRNHYKVRDTLGLCKLPERLKKLFKNVFGDIIRGGFRGGAKSFADNIFETFFKKNTDKTSFGVVSLPPFSQFLDPPLNIDDCNRKGMHETGLGTSIAVSLNEYKNVGNLFSN